MKPVQRAEGDKAEDQLFLKELVFQSSVFVTTTRKAKGAIYLKNLNIHSKPRSYQLDAMCGCETVLTSFNALFTNYVKGSYFLLQ